MRWRINNSYGLGLCVAVLLLLCVSSVMRPLRFQREQARREAVVKQRLLAIRAAEERFRLSHGAYTGDLGTLVASGLLADSLQYIPFSGDKKFRLAATVQVGRSGRTVPLVECSATYHDYLDGLDASQVAALADEAAEAGRFPGLRIGSLDAPGDGAPSWQ